MSNTIYSLRNVHQVYDNRTVLRIPSLDIRQGEVLAVVGPSGAGKSTLLRLLGLLEAPSRGEVVFHQDGHGMTYHTATIDERRKITMVFQQPALLSRSVRANVAFGLRLRGNRNGRQRIDAALKRVALDKLANASPRTLSGGELQRVAVARALVLEPRVLLLDEPTANLDPANVRLIENLIREQNTDHGATVVIVTHNIFQARRLATRVALLLEGELIEIAPGDQFFDDPRDPRTAAFLSGEFVC